MRILHTADWHLGVHSGPISRADDHAAFFQWLLDFIDDQAVQALVVAGDVFDSHQPSAAALQQYYDFLAACRERSGLQAVIVGGNHDSPSRLQAPAPVLRSMKVHVCGGLTLETVEAGDHVVPLRRPDGSVGAVVLAVPYVHEFRLGVRTTDVDHTAVRQRFHEAFRGLYRELADQAAERYPGAPIIATGHLTVGDTPAREDYPLEIHQVGTIEALSTDIFDPRIRYVALGHIHRSYPADGDRRAWYSGTPVATSVREADRPRRVLLLDVDSETGSVDVTPHEVPSPRTLTAVNGSLAEVKATIREMTWSEPLAPLLAVSVVEEKPVSGLQSHLQEALEAHEAERRPRIVELRQLRSGGVPSLETEESTPLEELDPGEVFEKLAIARGGGLDPDLRSAFSELRSMSEEDLEARIAELDGGAE